MRIAVVIPTHERRATVMRTVTALDEQTHRDFEVVVVVDGSSDGTAAALRTLRTSFPLTVVEQPRSGAAAARNAGVARTSGELLLFLDDDMRAAPALLAEHERSQQDGPALVIGDIPLDPDSPRNLLSEGVARWASRRAERLAAPGAQPRLEDLITGQMSIRRADFERFGGFDQSLTRAGLFGGEDVDFGYRAVKGGIRIVFNPAAVAYQYYDVDPREFLRRSHDAGRAAQELALKHPERAAELGRSFEPHGRVARRIARALARTPAPLTRPVVATAAALVRTGARDARLWRAFLVLRASEHARGSRDVRRHAGERSVVVLAYHAVADLSADPVLAPYGVPPERLAAQLDALARDGWRFVDLDTLLQGLDGEGAFPQRGVLVTFDDCYADLVDAAPLLEARGIRAVAFAVADRVGGSNDWDSALGAEARPLADANGLQALERRGVEIGSHGATHRRLAGLADAELRAELEGSAAALAKLGVRPPRALSYPHGVWDSAVAAAARSAGYRAAFTVSPGAVRGGADRYALPRVEVLAGDDPEALALRASAAASQATRLRRLALLSARARRAARSRTAA